MKRRLPKSDAAHLVGFGPADGHLGLQAAGGVGRPGFDRHIAWFCFLLFCFLCYSHSGSFALLNSAFGLMTVLCTLPSWRRRKQFPSRGGCAWPRACVLLTGLLRAPLSSQGALGRLSWALLVDTRCVPHTGLAFPVGGKRDHTYQMLHCQHAHLLSFFF